MAESPSACRLLLAAMTVAMIAGCAGPGANLVPGQSTAADVEKSMGRPKEKIADAGGESVWFYTTAPNGYTTYAVRMKPDGTVISVRQVLTKEYWSKVLDGRTTSKEARELLGPPSEVSRSRATNGDQWTYKVMNDNRMHLLIYDFSPEGVVAKSALMLDPIYSASDGM